MDLKHIVLFCWCIAAVDRSLSSSVVDAREAMVNACLDLIQAFKTTLSSGQAAALGLPIPHCARLVPFYVLALMKHVSAREKGRPFLFL